MRSAASNARTIRVSAIVIVFLVAVLALPRLSADARSEDSVRNFVDRVNEASMALVASESEAEARQQCLRLLEWAFDVPAMAQYALGEFWETTGAEGRKKFVAAFKRALITHYVRHVKANSKTTMIFAGDRPERNGQHLAATRLIHPDDPDQTWVWRLHRERGSWRVIDVSIHGRSALHSERREYAQIMEANKGDIGAVIAFIRSREDR
jgi:ABC-type transporter MlaC component